MLVDLSFLKHVFFFLQIFSRPYPMATAGTPYSLSFNIYSRIFEFKFFPTVPGENYM